MAEWEICREYRLCKHKAREITVLADLAGKSVFEIKNILNANGFNVEMKSRYARKQPFVWTEQAFETAIKLRLEGATFNEISKEIGCTYTSVIKHMEGWRNENESSRKRLYGRKL